MKLESLISIRTRKKNHKLQLRFLFGSFCLGEIFFFIVQQFPLLVGLLSVLVVMVSMKPRSL